MASLSAEGKQMAYLTVTWPRASVECMTTALFSYPVTRKQNEKKNPAIKERCKKHLQIEIQPEWRQPHKLPPTSLHQIWVCFLPSATLPIRTRNNPLLLQHSYLWYSDPPLLLPVATNLQLVRLPGSKRIVRMC
eukprot:Gregarina_sp_Poly_1__10169@NODE_69_length_16257_cov_66_887276_g59_i0_p9_GENE_NODE_69_length_16257_cov_66_887276_g59_i0NODE_69_length_16257_cov_66_887276_g59_i0_p9_ORF_typecomplete_len134_score2_25DcuA_DcuB/PF03605_14/0_05_NODE_69_length_16257_cov_66_887276_g59_i01230612707